MGFRFKSKFQKLAMVVIFLLVIFIFILIIPMAETDDSKENNQAEHPKVFSMNEVNGSGIEGDGQWYLDEGRIFLKVNLSGLSLKIDSPIHLRRGTCENPGSILVPLDIFQNGVSETRIALDITHDISKLNENMIVSVLKSPTEPKITVSCGVIEGGFSGVDVQMEH